MQRLDGREIYDYRNVNIDTDSELGNVTVTLGNTRYQEWFIKVCVVMVFCIG